MRSAADSWKPRRPRRRGGPASPVRATYKVEPEDFLVEEIAAYPFTGEGEHLMLWVEKRGIATMDVAAALAAGLGLRQRDVGYAGLKDARAVARQWFSVPRSAAARLSTLRLDRARILEQIPHRNKLKIGHARANRFTILLRGAGPEALEDARSLLDHMARRGVPNYFGEQRFGKRGANLEKGLRILRGDPARAARRMPKRLLGLLISAVQSEAFNRVLAARVETIDRVSEGDVAWLHRNGACFPVEDAAAERPRCETFEISPSGPLPGPETMQAHGAQGELEARVLAELGLEDEMLARMPRSHPGARRPLRVPLTAPDVRARPEGLEVSFELPRGAYATSVLRELLAATPWFG